jgi:hypothetical protein
VRFVAEFLQPLPTEDNALVFGADGRHCPAITVSACQDVRLIDVTIHHAGAMGVIAQRTRNIRLERLRVTPPPDGSQMVSTPADATHFVHCAGHVEILDCLFENQMDDPTNVHGIYARVVARDGRQTVEARLIHPQQFGCELAAAGERTEFVDTRTLGTFHEGTVRSVERLNKELLRLKFDEALPPPSRPAAPWAT